MKEYRDLFLQESGKHLKRVEALLEGRDAEAKEGPALVDALFREFHSYKGMAATMRFEEMARLAHRIEDHLATLKAKGGLGEYDRELVLRSSDKLWQMREDVEQGGEGVIDWSDLFTMRRDDPKPKDAPPSPVPSPPEKPSECLTAVIALDPDCSAPAARACLVVMRFMESAPGVVSEPPMEALSAGAKVESVRLSFQPGFGREDVEAVYATLTEVAGLSFGEEEKAATAAPEPPRQPRQSVEEQPRVFLPEAVEVPAAILDELVVFVGELNMLGSRLKEYSAESDNAYMREEARKLSLMVRDLDARVMEMRCFPFSSILGRLRRFVRENSEKLGKKVKLVVSGGSIGVDKTVMMRLSGPLTHLLRNSLDHGIEEPLDRIRQGKPEEGTITISLSAERNRLRLSISDDGKGIDPLVLGETALRKGLIKSSEFAVLDEKGLMELLFLPGFSTKGEVGDLSGRGVGMDAVATEVAALQGELSVASEVGAGTTFTIELPLSPSIAPVLTLWCGGVLLAIPVSAVSATFEVEPGSYEDVGGKLWISRDGETFRLRHLAEALLLPEKPHNSRIPVVELKKGPKRVLFQVDRLVAEEHLFVKPLKGLWSRLRGLGGYSVSGQGRIVYVVEPSSLFEG